MANKNTKDAPRAAAKPTPEQTPTPTGQPADLVPDQMLTGKEADGSDASKQAPVPAEPTSKDPAREQAPIEKEIPAKSAGRGKVSKTIRDTTAQAVAKQVFRSHPDKRTVYVTSDGTPFFAKCDAENYGRTLDDKLVVAVTNENNKA